jgi:hypothetical protein
MKPIVTARDALDGLEATLQATNVLSEDYHRTVLDWAYKAVELAHRQGMKLNRAEESVDPSEPGTPGNDDDRYELEAGLDELPRYFAVVNQTDEGWADEGWGGVAESPHMVCCVKLDDVRDMLAKQASGSR